MKKLFIFAFAITAISLGSCKKDRTCECTSSNTSTSGGSSSISTSSVVLKKIKKSEAKNLCQKTTYTNTDSNGTSVSTNDCKLK